MKKDAVLPDGTKLPEGYEFIEGEIYTPDGRVLTIEEYKNGYMAAPINTRAIMDQVTDQMKPLFDISEIIGNAKNVQKALNNIKALVNENKPGIKKDSSHENENLTLEQLFKDHEKYEKIMKLLASRKLIDPDSGICIDFSSGHPSYFVSIVMALHAKDYLNLKVRPQPREIIPILKNTFRIKVEERTAKPKKQGPDAQSGSDDPNNPMRFIPHESKI